MKPRIDNDTFVGKNLTRLVKKYPRERIIICNGEIFRGEEALKKARKKYPNIIPLYMPIPGPEEFSHILSLSK